MADHARKLSLLCVLVLLLLLLLILHLWSSRRARVVPHKRKLTRSSKHPACKGGMGAGGDGADMFMYGVTGGGGEGCFPSDTPRYDPALYAHLPPHLQSLPDDENWQPPPSTFNLTHGSTQSISDSGVWVGDQQPRQGPMTSLLFDGLHQRMCPPLDLQLSSGVRPVASRTLIINPASRSEGDASVGQSARRPGAASLQPTAAPAKTNIHAGPTVTRPMARVRASSEGRQANVVDDIIAKVSTMRATSDGDGSAGGGADCEIVEDAAADDVEEEDDEVDAEEPWPTIKSQKKTPARKPAPKGRGKGTAKDGGGESGGGRIIWNLDDSITLVRCKREHDETLAAAGHNFARMKTKQWKWTDIAKRMEVLGVTREWDVCMKRWENMFSWYKKVQWREKESGLQSFFTLTLKERADKGYNVVAWPLKAIHVSEGGGGVERECGVCKRVVKEHSRSPFDRQPSQAATMDIVICYRDVVLNRTVVFYEYRHRRGNSHGRAMEFDHHVNHEDFRYYEANANAVTCLAVVVGFRFGRRALREVIMHITRVGTAVPTRFVGGVDVLAEMVRMLISNFAMEFRDRMHHPATYTVVLHAPFEQRQDLHGDIDILREGMF
ncbi:hypothetical protein CBR_g45997 [Chara braunii]|uniref:Myb-like domain-containing protein n=1 Tax=Chara braunii TaxID=69332 RepID=A0A388LZY3_CHABU|nr:hypothetical protein CBR_g45997 [Chara braunii]|eukprot:GBG87841.1 hypothetical protein CBR_g45997 [Chara braunii]